MAWIPAGRRFVTTDGARWIAAEDSDDVNQVVVGRTATCAGSIIQYRDVSAIVSETPNGRTVTIPVGHERV